MSQDQSPKEAVFLYGAIFIALLSLLPWLSSYLSQAINVDIAYLSLSAERLLNGENMSEAYYDTNPPLSIIIQIPAVLIAKMGLLPLYHATSIYALGLLTLFAGLSYVALRSFKYANTHHVILTLYAFLLINTIGAGYDFGQKDHLLGMALFPFVLLQILITQRAPINKTVQCLALLSGSIFILLKPHYGLVPASILIHRAFVQKRITIFKDPDFLFLSVTALLYMGILKLFFDDFLTVILPDVILFYATSIDMEIVKTGSVFALFPFGCALLCRVYFKNDIPKFVSGLFLLSTVCFIPFIMQGKGWLYHLLPALILLSCAFAILFYGILERMVSDIKNVEMRGKVVFTITFISLLSIPAYSFINKSSTLTHASYKQTEFVKIVNDCEKENCSFLILHDMINIAPELSVYTGQTHASRFPVMWFAPALLSAGNETDKQTIDHRTQKYMMMMAEDFEKYSPEVLFIAHMPHPTRPDELFNYKDYTLAEAPELFKKIWNNYDISRTIAVDRLDYMPAKKPSEKSMRYDIYRKK